MRLSNPNFNISIQQTDKTVVVCFTFNNTLDASLVQAEFNRTLADGYLHFDSGDGPKITDVSQVQ